jgi:type IV pilus secretin PilQ/predicted competence protein
MKLPMPRMTLARPAATVALTAAVAAVLSAGSAPIRLLGVSTEANAVLIEATEPVAYAVSRPDPLTVLVDLRNVTVAEAAAEVRHHEAVAAVTLEQTSGVDGKAMARVHVMLARPAEHVVRSTRNTIRLELTPTAGSAPAAVRPPAAAAPARSTAAPATILDRVRVTRSAGLTTVTLGGNGRLTPATVMEPPDAPRRLFLDFANVASKAPAATPVADNTLVTRVRVEPTPRLAGATRVVIDVTPGSTYHVEQAGAKGQDLAVVFEPALILGSPKIGAAPADADPEPDIPLAQAIANAAPLTPAPRDVDPIAALKLLPPPAAAKSAPPAASLPAGRPGGPSGGPLPRVAPPASRTAQAPQTPPLQAERPPAPAVPPTPAPQTPPAQTPPAPLPPSLQTPAPGQEKQYSGQPITLDFENADLKSILRVLGMASGLNMIIDPAVPATPVNILLKDLPWDQALEVILRSYQLGYEAEGTVIRIAPLKVLEDEQKQRNSLAQATALAGELQVRTFALSYAKANDLSALLTQSALSQRGKIQVDGRTNVLIITDLPERLQTAAQLIGTLDRPEPQVEVEARIVQTTRDFAKALGVQWGLNGRVSPAIGNTTNLAFPNSGSIGGRTGATNTPQDLSRATGSDNTATAVNLPVPGATSAIGLALGAVNGAFNLDVALSALEKSGKGRVLSTPKLTTQNNIQAEVAQGVQIPIQTVSNNTVTVTFKDAVLKLTVTPQITSANTVIMQITVENATADFSRQVNGIPPVNTQRAATQVQVNDGATTIIGGIFVSQEQSAQDRVPGLHRIPLLGWLFKRDSITDSSTELLIFITPRILGS